MSRDRILVWALRAAGVVEMLAFVSVVMPREWMEVSHRRLGMGDMPEGAVLMFMIRQASYAYGMHGILLWLLASDVRRYRPVIVFTGATFLLAGPVFFAVDYTSGMPLWWTLADSIGCAILGAVVLWASRGGASDAVLPTAAREG